MVKRGHYATIMKMRPHLVQRDVEEVCGVALAKGGACKRPKMECPYHGDR